MPQRTGRRCSSGLNRINELKMVETELIYEDEVIDEDMVLAINVKATVTVATSDVEEAKETEIVRVADKDETTKKKMNRVEESEEKSVKGRKRG